MWPRSLLVPAQSAPRVAPPPPADGLPSGGHDARERTIDVLTTPSEAFEGLPDWPYELRHVTVDAGTGPVRVAVWEAGSGPTVLLLHGEPTWSYLYRKMVPGLVDAGCRVVMPDLVGFGASDKPTELDDHSYANHVAWTSQALHDELDLTDVVAFVQDWGGLIGLRCVAAAPERYSGVVASNTGLTTGDQQMPEAFLSWRAWSRQADPFPIGQVINGFAGVELPAEELAAYEAPFPDESYKAGPKVMPSLVPATPDDPEAPAQRAAWAALQRFESPFLTAYSDDDPVTAGANRFFEQTIPGAQGQAHRTIEGAGHFTQEQAPDECVAAILELRLP